MSLPSDGILKHMLMRMIGKQPAFTIEMHDAIRILQPQFPQLTRDETAVPYGTSESHFANRVQWAAAHLKDEHWLQKAPISGIGHWTFTTKARAQWDSMFPDGDQLLAELMAQPDSQ